MMPSPALSRASGVRIFVASIAPPLGSSAKSASASRTRAVRTSAWGSWSNFRFEAFADILVE